jgi:hypothetical protein
MATQASSAAVEQRPTTTRKEDGSIGYGTLKEGPREVGIRVFGFVGMNDVVVCVIGTKTMRQVSINRTCLRDTDGERLRPLPTNQYKYPQ